MIFNELRRTAVPKISFLVNQSYVFKQLSPSNRHEAVELLASEFQMQEPLTNAYYRLLPSKTFERLQNWKKFLEMYSEDFITNETSIGCFDREKDDKLVGVCVAKDYSFTPEGFEDHYMNNINFVSSLRHLKQELLKQAASENQPLPLKNKVMDIWGAALSKEHMGKRLLHKMIMANVYFGALKQYNYAFAFATNFKTTIALEKLNFEKVSEMDSSNFSLEGIRYFKQVEGIHKCPSLWLKKIRSKVKKEE